MENRGRQGKEQGCKSDRHMADRLRGRPGSRRALKRAKHKSSRGKGGVSSGSMAPATGCNRGGCLRAKCCSTQDTTLKQGLPRQALNTD